MSKMGRHWQILSCYVYYNFVLANIRTFKPKIDSRSYRKYSDESVNRALQKIENGISEKKKGITRSSKNLKKSKLNFK